MRTLFIIPFILISVTAYAAILEDHEHYSEVMGQSKHYRVYLPPDYYNSDMHYPVIYWMHGHGGTYTMTKYHEQWDRYIDTHNVILVIPNPRNPNGSTYDYSLVFDNRTYEGTPAHNDKIFSKYFPELVLEVDKRFRTIPDRDHRGISGQSRGGFISPYIAGQNKDLLSASSVSCPSPDGTMVGPMNEEVLFPVYETGRALKGVSLRITSPDGDRYKQYAWELKALWDMMDIGHVEMHVAHYPTHYAADMEQQFDFHMREFEKKHPVPSIWHHADPWTDFTVWNYSVSVKRDIPAITFMENVSSKGMIFYSRPFLPEGPIIQGEHVTIISDSIYTPSHTYSLVAYNLNTSAFSENEITSDEAGKIEIEFDGGGHIFGINKNEFTANLFLVDANNREDHYAEESVGSKLSLLLVNVGTARSGPIQITASTPKDFITLSKPILEISNINPGKKEELNIEYLVSDLNLSVPQGSDNILDGHEFVSKISLELTYGKGQKETQSFRIFPMPIVEKAKESDVIVLDGRSMELPFYQNQYHKISKTVFTGGEGDGDGLAEPGEIIELLVRIPQGLGPNDQNTFHRAFLVNQDDDPFIEVNSLTYHMRGEEWSGAPCIQSQIYINPSTPNDHILNLLVRLESYNFVEEGYENFIQRHKFDFRRVALSIINP